METIITKRCVQCKEILSIDKFGKHKGRKDGHNDRCKKCNVDHVRQWQKANPDKVSKRNKKWKENHKDQVSAIRRKNNEKQSQWRKENPDLARRKDKEYRLNNLKGIREKVLRWQKNHPDQRVVNERNREARKRNNGGKVTQKEWTELCEKYEHKCLCCGKKPKRLTMDHIVPISLGGIHAIENIQPLCGLCNSVKRTKIIDYRPKF